MHSANGIYLISFHSTQVNLTLFHFSRRYFKQEMGCAKAAQWLGNERLIKHEDPFPSEKKIVREKLKNFSRLVSPKEEDEAASMRGKNTHPSTKCKSSAKKAQHMVIKFSCTSFVIYRC